MPIESTETQNIDCAMIKIEILAFFLANPHTRDTLSGFSRRLFINHHLIDEAMEDLVSLGIVERSGNSDKSIYRLKISYSTLEEHLA